MEDQGDASLGGGYGSEAGWSSHGGRGIKATGVQ